MANDTVDVAGYDREKVAKLLSKLNGIQYGVEGSVAALIETPEPHRHVEREHVEVTPGKGFAGDHDRKSTYRGRHVEGREVSAIAIEVLRILDIAPRVPGDNLITEGVDLGAVARGEILRIGDVILRRSEKAHRPCTVFRDRSSPEAFAAASRGNFRGALFVVVQGGTIRKGDLIETLS